ncbi:MAG: hypothetical protein R3C45_13120 [Phycisphaerales bacterium]
MQLAIRKKTTIVATRRLVELLFEQIQIDDRPAECDGAVTVLAVQLLAIPPIGPGGIRGTAPPSRRNN